MIRCLQQLAVIDGCNRPCYPNENNTPAASPRCAPRGLLFSRGDMVREIDAASDWPARLLARLGTLEERLFQAMRFLAAWQELPMWQALGESAGTP